MSGHLRSGIRIMGRTGLRTHAFWTCFAILAALAAVYGAVLAFTLKRGDLLELADRPILAWRIALGCWLAGVPFIWAIARMESSWVVRRVQLPIASLVRQCSEIRAGRVPARLRYSGVDDELAGLADAINELLGHCSRSVRCQHEFATDAAHELRTPLTAQSVVGENALARRCTGAELREAIGSMLEESKHMKRLIEALLELSRASAAGAADCGTLRDPAPLELAMLAHRCVDSLQILAEEKKQRIQLHADPVWANADVTLVRQALLNVIHNAIEHCPEGSYIRVVTGHFGRDQAMIRVSDDGPGIALDQQPHIFKRFYRASNVSPRRSLGLGLSIAKAVLRSQRGDIHLRSEAGAGCSFTLTLPRLSVEPRLLESAREAEHSSGVG